MSKSNIEQSIRQKLLNVSISKGVDYNLVLIWYALERFLYRLSKSKYADQFILKGAMLFAVWADQPLRPTKDLDFMAYGDSSPDFLRKVISEICKTKVEEDGIIFDTDNIDIGEIREEQEYGGQRVKLNAKLGNAKIRGIQIDIGFGDAVTPAPAVIEYPVLLESTVPTIKAYPKETVIAEKLHAIIILGIANSRMKDFYDLWIMSKQFDFDGSTLAEAIGATFKRRKTPLPDDIPMAFTEIFSSDVAINQRWQAFINKLKQSSEIPPFDIILSELKDFLMVPLQYAKAGKSLNEKWTSSKWIHT